MIENFVLERFEKELDAVGKQVPKWSELAAMEANGTEAERRRSDGSALEMSWRFEKRMRREARVFLSYPGSDKSYADRYPERLDQGVCGGQQAGVRGLGMEAEVMLVEEYC